jgi:hypothetical protein
MFPFSTRMRQCPIVRPCNGIRDPKNRRVPASNAVSSCVTNRRRNKRERTRTGRKKPGRVSELVGRCREALLGPHGDDRRDREDDEQNLAQQQSRNGQRGAQHV